jgi:hypothetical protein
MSQSHRLKENVPIRQVIKTWWPLAASWLLMGLEAPALSAVMARMANPEINLAAYGGVVYPLILIIESPIIMLLAASTALCKDWSSYQRIKRFMLIAGVSLTAVHLLIALTPAYYLVVRTLIKVPEEIVEPARLGLIILTPWTWAIAYRRFQQGLLIRFGHSRAVGIGTAIRLIADGAGLAVGYSLNTFSGIVVATVAQAAGVISEAVYAGLRVRPVIRHQLKPAPPQPELKWRAFLVFYYPLALTSFLSLFWQPLGAAAISRMPLALASLAIWPIVSGLVFILRSFGFAYNEVVVALLGRQGSTHNLRKFSLGLTVTILVVHLIFAATPAAQFWFGKISALDPALVDLAAISFWLALPLPFLSVLTSWYQGAIVYSQRTRAIPESLVIFFISVLILLGIGVAWINQPGIYIGMAAFSIATMLQTVWLYVRSREVMWQTRERDAKGDPMAVSA